MANGYYRASGRLAALVTIPGPGFTFALTGLAEALHDSAALLHLVGAPPPGDRRFRFQSVDQRAIAAPVAKAFRTVSEAPLVEDAALEAIDLAVSGEPGPVVLEWTVSALEGAAPAPHRPRPAPSEPDIDETVLERVAQFLAGARRPLLVAGQGCADAAGPLRRLAELLCSPVVTTTSGRGVLPEDHPLALGFEFVGGDLATLNELTRSADAILVLGCKLTEAGTSMFGLDLPAERLVQIESGPSVAGATYPSRFTLVGRVEVALPRLISRIAVAMAPGHGWSAPEVQGWRSRLRARVDLIAEPRVLGVRPATVAALCAALDRTLPRDAIVVTDSGLHQTLIRRHLLVRAPRGLIVPSDFQSMGFGLPAAIGAKLASPDRTVVAVVGDGGFAMNGLELLTAAREGIPLTVLVFNDGQLNRIRLQQIAQYGHPVAVGLQNPDFETLATAVGARYARVDGDPEGVLREALAAKAVTLVEVLLEDARSLPLERAKGLARGAVRRAASPFAVASFRTALRRLRGGRG
jgi:acetolactate synthase-1/2/3 large subunit